MVEDSITAGQEMGRWILWNPGHRGQAELAQLRRV
jgi:hypothetical protein